MHAISSPNIMNLKKPKLTKQITTERTMVARYARQITILSGSLKLANSFPGPYRNNVPKMTKIFPPRTIAAAPPSFFTAPTNELTAKTIPITSQHPNIVHLAHFVGLKAPHS